MQPQTDVIGALIAFAFVASVTTAVVIIAHVVFTSAAATLIIQSCRGH